MAWSSFAHLPTSEEEYLYILSNLKNGMPIQDVDSIIASYKDKEKVQHHYRSNLAKLGLFEIVKSCITLNYDEKKLQQNKKSLKMILRNALAENQTDEIEEVARAIIATRSYDLNDVVEVIVFNNPYIQRSSLVRWVRPIVTLLKIVDILSKTVEKENKLAKYLQDAYLRVDTGFGNSISLELLENELRKTDETFSIIPSLDNLLENFDMRFKIELLMLPSWATKNKSYRIGQDLYTHIKLKADLLKEDGNEQKYST